MLNEILYPALCIGAIGLFFGAVLAFASIIFKVEKDERIDIINEQLPGANCGGCGYAGCGALAQAIVENEESPLKCNMMTQEKAQIIAGVMGVEVYLRFLSNIAPKQASFPDFVYAPISNCSHKLTPSGFKQCSAVAASINKIFGSLANVLSQH